jgi:RimJ/RimL family protein N-acetyltransferase
VRGRLELDRLVLEPLDGDLARDIVDGRSREEFADGFPTSAERRVAEWLLRPDRPELEPPFCVFVVREREGDLMIGSAGYHGPPRQRVAEIGYGLVPARWGQGLAAEAVRGLLGAARESGSVDRVLATVDERNRASISVLERCGFERAAGSASTWQLDLD